MSTPENDPAAIARGDRGGKQNQATPSYRSAVVPVKCSACGGHGTRLRRTGFDPEDAIISETCEHCGGSGVEEMDAVEPERTKRVPVWPYDGTFVDVPWDADEDAEVTS